MANDEANKRQKLLQDALDLDKDDRDEESDTKNGEERGDESEEDSDEEDNMAELMQELKKIKHEWAEEKERQEREQLVMDAAAQEAEVATVNPLLNLTAMLGQSPSGISTTAPGMFAMKWRCDDGMLMLWQQGSRLTIFPVRLNI